MVVWGRIIWYNNMFIIAYCLHCHQDGGKLTNP